MSLTDQQKKEYLESPNTCPYCGSEELDSDHFQADDNYAWREVRCLDCKKEWQDQYSLTGISEYADA